MSSRIVNCASEGDGEPPAKPFKPNYSEIITVLVGQEERKFLLHKATAIAKSPFLQAAFSNSRWPEAQEGTIKLPDAHPEAFEVFVHWAYTDSLDVEMMTEPTPKPDSGTVLKPSYRNLGLVWSLGNYLQSRELRNRVISRTVRKFNERTGDKVSEGTIAEIWEVTPEGCTLRRLIIDVMLSRASKEYLAMYGDKWPPDMLMAATKKWFAGESKEDFEGKGMTFDDSCRHHEHDEGERCL